jgi:Protein kinase domain
MGDESAPAAVAARDGTVIAGRYRLVHLLGEGDRKRTYLAEDTLLAGREVALALVKPEAAGSDPRGTMREVEAICQTGHHDNIVTLYDRGIVEGTEYLVFEYLSGGNLRDYLDGRRWRRDPLSADEVRRLGRQLARAVSRVHDSGLLHRDVAPANIWLDERAVPHLGDFDSAIPKDSARETALPPTTEAYAAPEQIAGEPIDERSDLYSLGAVLYEALTGESPRKVRKVVVAPKAVRPDTPPDLNAIICKLMAARPEDRPGSAEQLLEALKPPFAQRRLEGLFPWAEGLPFPLASILWHYDAEPDPRPKVDHLLNFFEALAQFRTTFLLSGLLTDRALQDTCKPAWFGPGGGSRPMDLETAPGFGVWVELSERLSQTARSMLCEQEGAERCYGVFAAQDRELVDAMTSRELTALLLQARDRRNAAAHGGFLARHALEEELHVLASLLAETQSLLVTAFETWTLLRPGPAMYDDEIFDLTATILTGTNPAFRKAHIQVREPLSARRLYLLNGTSLHALKLVPFLQVMPGPKTGEDACYFYNRMEPTGLVRWVSYHSAAEPEFTLNDPDVVKLLAELKASSGSSGT